VEPKADTGVTLLLREVSDGDREAFDELVPLVYEQLRRMAHRQLRAERANHTLNTTALVHEAYLELVDVDHSRWQDRAHFFAAASRVMRHLLVDYARARNAYKRGGDRVQVPLDEQSLRLSEEYADAVEGLDEALSRLEKLSSRQSQILEQRYFGGLSLKECAQVAGVSLTTVKEDLFLARAWLARELAA
jgi:RNA polymerase sigma factor (TIGR02999 family)